METFSPTRTAIRSPTRAVITSQTAAPPRLPALVRLAQSVPEAGLRFPSLGLAGRAKSARLFLLAPMFGPGSRFPAGHGFVSPSQTRAATASDLTAAAFTASRRLQ